MPLSTRVRHQTDLNEHDCQSEAVLPRRSSARRSAVRDPVPSPVISIVCAFRADIDVRQVLHRRDQDRRGLQLRSTLDLGGTRSTMPGGRSPLGAGRLPPPITRTRLTLEERRHNEGRRPHRDCGICSPGTVDVAPRHRSLALRSARWRVPFRKPHSASPPLREAELLARARSAISTCSAECVERPQRFGHQFGDRHEVLRLHSCRPIGRRSARRRPVRMPCVPPIWQTRHPPVSRDDQQ